VSQQNHRATFAALSQAIGRTVIVEKPLHSSDLGAPTAPELQLYTGVLEFASAKSRSSSVSLIVSGQEIMLSLGVPGASVSLLGDQGVSELFLG